MTHMPESFKSSIQLQHSKVPLGQADVVIIIVVVIVVVIMVVVMVVVIIINVVVMKVIDISCVLVEFGVMLHDFDRGPESGSHVGAHGDEKAVHFGGINATAESEDGATVEQHTVADKGNFSSVGVDFEDRSRVITHRAVAVDEFGKFDIVIVDMGLGMGDGDEEAKDVCEGEHGVHDDDAGSDEESVQCFVKCIQLKWVDV